MIARHIHVDTPHASKYLQQLCKHFGHKVEATCDPHSGFAALPPGPCTLRAENNHLYIHCQAKDEAGLDTMKYIIETHLVKFAWREDLSLNWEDCPPHSAGNLA